MLKRTSILSIALVTLMALTVVSGAGVMAASTSGVPAGSFVGSKDSNVYHYPSCGHVKTIKQANLVVFSSVADACAHGYRPCKDCNPPPCQATSTPTATPTGTPTPTPAPSSPSDQTSPQQTNVQSPTGSFAASVNSKIYHYAWCREVKNIHAENLQTFSSVAEACAAGHNEPCDVCRPPPCQVTPTLTPTETPTVNPTATPTVTPTTNLVATSTPSVNQLASASVTPAPSTKHETKSTPEFPLPLAGAATMVIVTAIYAVLRKRL